MIDVDKKVSVYDIWLRLPSSTKESVLKRFPSSKGINDPEVAEYLLRHYSHKLQEIVIK